MSSNEAAVSSSAVYAFDILMKLKEAGFSGLDEVMILKVSPREEGGLGTSVFDFISERRSVDEAVAVLAADFTKTLREAAKEIYRGGIHYEIDPVAGDTKYDFIAAASQKFADGSMLLALVNDSTGSLLDEITRRNVSWGTLQDRIEVAISTATGIDAPMGPGIGEIVVWFPGSGPK